jgi:hypothetical protein
LQRYLGYLLVVAIAILLIECSHSAQHSSTLRPPPTSWLVTAQNSEQSSHVKMPAPQFVALSPILVPTATPVAVVVPTPTLPYPTLYDFNGALRIEATPIPAAAQVVCVPQEEFIKCYDELLDMSFSYPAFIGQLRYTWLRKGHQAGYAYEYVFEESKSRAGGRSRDFAEGREAWLTDQMGFDGRGAAEICAAWLENGLAAMCQVFGPGVLLMILLPQAEGICSNPMFTEIPRGLLILDLPQHPLINGFAFTFELMPVEAAEDFRGEWYVDDKHCDPQTNVELGIYSDRLRQALESGSADTEIQQRYDAMIQVAMSIESPFIANNSGAVFEETLP